MMDGMIKLKRMRVVGHVAFMGRCEMYENLVPKILETGVYRISILLGNLNKMEVLGYRSRTAQQVEINTCV
jgi:hypothetical protein